MIISLPRDWMHFEALFMGVRTLEVDVFHFFFCWELHVHRLLTLSHSTYPWYCVNHAPLSGKYIQAHWARVYAIFTPQRAIDNQLFI